MGLVQFLSKMGYSSDDSLVPKHMAADMEQERRWEEEEDDNDLWMSGRWLMELSGSSALHPATMMSSF